jgi:hypothetical protein
LARLTAIAALATAIIGISFLVFDSAAQDANNGTTNEVANGMASGQGMTEKDRMPGDGMTGPGMGPGNDTAHGLMVVPLKGVCSANQTCFTMKNITGACPDGAICYMRDDHMKDDHASPMNQSGAAPAKPDSKKEADRPGQGANGQSGKPPAMSGGAMDLGMNDQGMSDQGMGGQDMMSDLMGTDGMGSMGGMGDQGAPGQGQGPMGQGASGGAAMGPMGKPGQNMTGPGGKPPEMMKTENETGERFMIVRFAGDSPVNQTCFVMENITGSCPDGRSCYKIDDHKLPLNQSSAGQPPAKPNEATGSNWKRE